MLETEERRKSWRFQMELTLTMTLGSKQRHSESITAWEKKRICFVKSSRTLWCKGSPFRYLCTLLRSCSLKGHSVKGHLDVLTLAAPSCVAEFRPCHVQVTPGDSAQLSSAGKKRSARWSVIKTVFDGNARCIGIFITLISFAPHSSGDWQLL